MRERLRIFCFAVGGLAWLRADSIAAQTIFTVAGGFSSEGRPATVVGLNGPEGLALDPTGHLYIAEGFGDRVRKLDLRTALDSPSDIAPP